MRRKEILRVIGATGVASLLLWVAVQFHSPRLLLPAADAYVTSEMEAIRKLRQLLLQKPHQSTFVICWQATHNDRTGWSHLRYNRAKHTLIYTPYRHVRKGWQVMPGFPFVANFRNPINTGCPKQYVCKSAKETLIVKAKPYEESIGTILMLSGCNRNCLIVT